MSERLPIDFVGHGNPMNALGGTPLAAHLAEWGARLPKVRALLVVSAHWRAGGAHLTAALMPETVHDFYGFPKRLFALRYPALGQPELAQRVAELLRASGFEARLDEQRGLDHGVWAPLIVARPAADLPIVQLSLLRASPARHLELGAALAPLRDQGVLILGSGNVVHNLATAVMDDPQAPVVPWAASFDALVRARLIERDYDGLANLTATPEGREAHPTDEHFLPLLVCAGAAGAEARVSFPFEAFEHGSISSRCVRFD